MILLVAGCTDLRDPRPAGPAAELPPRFSLYGEAPDPADPWWRIFQSPELHRLIEDGIAGNPGVAATWARLRQARAVAAKAGTERLPAFSIAAGAAHQRHFGDGQDDAADGFSAEFFAGYELDLWGRVRAEGESSDAAAGASLEDAWAAVVSLSGQIAGVWVEYLVAGKKEQHFLYQLELHKKLLGLIETRFGMAGSSALDLYQQRQTIAAIEGGLVTVRGRMDVLRHQLAVLSGRPATSHTAPQERELPPLKPLPPAGVPADLLARRPDIRAAGLRLRAAEWEVAAAKADRLPALILNGSLAASSSVLEVLLDTWLLRLAASLTGPVFDGGRRQAEVERIRAVVDERLALYRQVVLAAIEEVENSLSAEAQQRKTIENIDLQIDLTRKAYREATFRYLNGLNDFLPVLREQINLITLQLDQIQAQGDLVLARIALHRALGGSWPAAYTPNNVQAAVPAKEQ